MKTKMKIAAAPTSGTSVGKNRMERRIADRFVVSRRASANRKPNSTLGITVPAA